MNEPFCTFISQSGTVRTFELKKGVRPSNINIHWRMIKKNYYWRNIPRQYKKQTKIYIWNVKVCLTLTGLSCWPLVTLTVNHGSKAGSFFRELPYAQKTFLFLVDSVLSTFKKSLYVLRNSCVFSNVWYG